VRGNGEEQWIWILARHGRFRSNNRDRPFESILLHQTVVEARSASRKVTVHPLGDAAHLMRSQVPYSACFSWVLLSYASASIASLRTSHLLEDAGELVIAALWNRRP
jgi:hypothetical protein